MKRIWELINLVITLLLVVGIVWLYKESQGLQKDVKHLKEKLAAIGEKEIRSDSIDLKEKLSALESSTKEETVLSIIRAEGKIRELAEAVSRTKERLDKLPEMPGIDPDAAAQDNVLVTRAEVKKLLEEGLKKSTERGRSPWARKKVTLDEVATELNLTYEQQLELQKIHTEGEKKFVQIIFDIKDEAQMTEFKAKLAEAEYNPAVKKELQETMTTRIFSESPKFMPVLMQARNQIRECLGEEKAAEYEANNYEVDTQSELSPAIKIIQDTFKPLGQRKPLEEPEKTE